MPLLLLAMSTARGGQPLAVFCKWVLLQPSVLSPSDPPSGQISQAGAPTVRYLAGPPTVP